MDEISEIAHLMLWEIFWDLLNDTTISEILLKTPACGVIKLRSLKCGIINEFSWDFIKKWDSILFLMTLQQLYIKPHGFLVKYLNDKVGLQSH